MLSNGVSSTPEVLSTHGMKARYPNSFSTPGRSIGLQRASICLLIAAVWAAVGACTPAAHDKGVTPQTRTVGPSEQISSPPAPFQGRDQTEAAIRLSGAVNETIAFQFVLSAAAGPAAGVELTTEDLVGPVVIPKEAVRMYRPWPVVVERFPNWYLRAGGRCERREIPDALVPIEAGAYGQPFNISAGQSLPIWVEIRMPSTTLPGTYETAIAMRDAAGRTFRTPVQVTVRDIYLAPEDAVPILARVQLAPIIAAHTQLDPQNIKLALADAEASRILRRAFELLHDHGLSPYTDDVRPLFTQNVAGQVEPDWSQYDEFCGPLIDGSAFADKRPAHAWPIPADLSQPDPAQFGGIRSAVYAGVLRDYLNAAKLHFEERGWLDRAFVQIDLPDAVNPQAEDLDLIRQIATVTHLVDARLAFVSALIPQSMAPFGWFEHRHADLSAEVDVWSTPARYQHQPTMQAQRALGKRTWLLPDRPPFSGSLAVEAAPVLARSLTWQAFLQGHDAIVLPRATDWPERVFDEPIRDRCQPSDTWLLYPGRLFGLDEPVPSVRLKQLQLGRQDYQYLRLLSAHGGAETARLLAGSLIKACGTDAYGDNYQDGLFGRQTTDAATWQLARSILEDETADLLSPEPGKTLDPEASRAAWAKFLSATRGIEMWCESARLTQGQTAEGAGWLVTFDLVIRSELRMPLEGRLRFGQLLEGFRSVSDIIRVGPLAEMGLARRQLVLALPTLPPCDLDGHFAQEVVFDAGASGLVTTQATVAAAMVARVDHAITVDGDLADWPPAEYNAVGNLRLTNGRRDGAEEGRPAESQTVAFLCQNDGTLYIGLHSASPAGASGAVRNSNVVEYEDLMPVGSDLVEVLIDPTNAGTQSGDLFHIVLQSTGDPVFERGIGAQPPMGEWQPWPGRPPRYAVASTEYGWSAELAIAIESLGPEAARSRVWGFNIARLEPRRGEYSDWARAARYCYDPRTLGNLVWP